MFWCIFSIVSIVVCALFLLGVIITCIFFPIKRDRLMISKWFFPIVLGIAVAIPAVVFGILVVADANPSALWSEDKHYSPSLGWSVYYHFVNQGSQHMAEGGFVGWSTALAILGTIVLNGLLVSSLISIVDRRKERWLKGEVRYGSLFIRRHTIVIGGSDVAIGIVRDIIAKRKKHGPIVVLAKCNIEKFRRNLKSQVGDIRDVVIYYGDRTSKQDIEALYPYKAEEIFVIGEDIFNKNNDDESYHDTLNIKCLQLLGAASEKRIGEVIDCHVMFEYQTTFAALQISNIDSKKIKFRPFNYYEAWALKVFGGDCPKANDSKGYIPLDGEGISKDEDEFVHLVVVGMSRMGIALANMAAHLAHYPNFVTKKLRTRISFIDINVEQEAQYYMGRFEELFKYAQYRFLNTSKDKKWCCKMAENNPKNYLGENLIDVEWEFVGGAIDSKEVRDYLVESANEQGAKLTIAICLPESNRAVASAIYMPEVVYHNAQEVLVYQRNGGEVIEQISESNFHYRKKLRPFGMDDDCYDIEQYEELDYIADRVGKAWEKANKEYCQQMPRKNEATDDKKEEKQAKSPSSKLWSSYYNAYTARSKFRSCNKARTTEDYLPLTEFNTDELSLMSKVEHNRWVVEQLLFRYRPLTPTEQEMAKREHANMSNERKEKFKKVGAHLNICSNEVLDSLDRGIVKMDQELVKILPSTFNDFRKEHKKDNA